MASAFSRIARSRRPHGAPVSRATTRYTSNAMTAVRPTKNQPYPVMLRFSCEANGFGMPYSPELPLNHPCCVVTRVAAMIETTSMTVA